ncbi:MAG: hypothetical protein WCK67_05385 [bacterium]
MQINNFNTLKPFHKNNTPINNRIKTNFSGTSTINNENKLKDINVICAMGTHAIFAFMAAVGAQILSNQRKGIPENKGCLPWAIIMMIISLSADFTILNSKKNDTK